MNKTETEVIKSAIRRLRADNNKSASDAVLTALKDPQLRIYLETWVIAPLEILVDPERTPSDLKTAWGLARIGN